MSKYNPLRESLQKRRGDQAAMSFAEIESILGFSLPASARQFREWWANTRGSHVQAAAWLDAGWQTSQVDVERESLVFTRADFTYPAPSSARLKVEEGDPAVIVIRRQDLTPGALRLLQDCAEELGGALDQAAVLALNAAAMDRRRRLVEEFRALAGPQSTDSVDLVREDRDAR